jgi:cytochrome c553
MILLAVVVGVLHFVGQSRLNRAPAIQTQPVAAASGAEAIARGQHLAKISACFACHGQTLAGTEFINEAPIGYVPAPNLTASGVGAKYSDEDWERAIRHGVAKDGRVITIMSNDHYAHYGDDDLADLIAYLKSVPAAEDKLSARNVQFPGTIIFGLLAYNSWAVNRIDHSAVGGHVAPPTEPSAAYGKYLVSIASCQSCHGENLAGNMPDADSPHGPNITPGGKINGWALADFAQTLRTGQTPDGRQLNAEMPWAYYSDLSDVEVEAIFNYLQGLEALANN